MTVLPRMTTSPIELPSRGTGAPAASHTSTSPPSTVGTPWRALSAARRSAGSAAHSGGQAPTVAGP